jgi:alpha-N-arabinofuranosidase
LLTSANPGDVNSLDNPTNISPKEETLEVSGSAIHYDFKPMSLTVLRIPYR